MRWPIQIEERFHNTTRAQLALAAGASLPGGLLTFMALANVAMGPLGILLGLAVPTVAYGAARALHGRRIENTQERLGSLGDQLAELLRG